MTFQRIRGVKKRDPIPTFRHKDLISAQEVGKGAFGTVHKVEMAPLTQSASMVKSDTPLTYAIKFSGPLPSRKKDLNKETEDMEIIISTYLSDAIAKNQMQGKKNGGENIIPGQPIIFEGQLGLQSRFVTYNKKNSDDLERYLKKLNQNVDFATQSTAIVPSEKTHKNAFGQHNLGITLARLNYFKKVGLNGVHELGIFHFDVADRNFLVEGNLSVAIADFGLSRFIPENGIVKDRRKFPINWTDFRGNYKREFTIATELFGVKMSMLESVLSTLGIKKTDSENIFGSLRDLRNDIYTRGKKNNLSSKQMDEELLKAMFRRVMEGAKDKIEQDPSLRAYLNSHYTYLTTMPTEHDTYDPATLAAVRREDNQRLEQAMNNFKQQVRTDYKNFPPIENRLAALPKAMLPVSQAVHVAKKTKDSYETRIIEAANLSKSIQTYSQLLTKDQKHFLDSLERLIVREENFWKKQGWIEDKMPDGIQELKRVLQGDEPDKLTQIHKIAKRNILFAKKTITKDLYQAALQDDLKKVNELADQISLQERGYIETYPENLDQSGSMLQTEHEGTQFYGETNEDNREFYQTEPEDEREFYQTAPEDGREFYQTAPEQDLDHINSYPTDSAPSQASLDESAFAEANPIHVEVSQSTLVETKSVENLDEVKSPHPTLDNKVGSVAFLISKFNALSNSTQSPAEMLKTAIEKEKKKPAITSQQKEKEEKKIQEKNIASKAEEIVEKEETKRNGGPRRR